MQEFLWDGIKRDRLVWMGDMHPEVMTISHVFGYNEIVPESLDLARDITPLPGWMSGMYTYSLWWVIVQRDWYKFHGDLEYLKQQRDYLTGLLEILLKKVDDNGLETSGGGFLDWPSNANQPAMKAGTQALMMMTMEAALGAARPYAAAASAVAAGNSKQSKMFFGNIFERALPKAMAKQPAAAHSLRSHICRLRSIFAEAHVPGENHFNVFCA